jgi:hypothetical protein
MKKYKVHIIWAIIAVVALGGGYFWGKSTVAVGRSGFAGAYGAFGSSTRRTAGAGAGGGFVTGQITAMDSSSITLQLANGNSEVVFYSTSTSVTEPTTVPVSELTTGSNVMIGGTSNSDGSLTAQTIQVRPANTTGSGGAARGTSATGQ